MPTEIGTYTVQLIVNDGLQDSVPVTMNVIREEPIIYTREIRGKLIDKGNNGVTGVKIGRFGVPDVYTDEAGSFLISLTSSSISSGLNNLVFNSQDKLRGILGFKPYENESDSKIDLGNIPFPVFQRKDLTLHSCHGYAGPAR